MRKGIVAVLTILFLMHSTVSVVGQDPEQTPTNCSLNFDGDLANQSIQFQTELGPRIPGSAASSALRDSIKSNLTGWDITESIHHLNGMTLTNMFATWNKGAGSNVILAAHYDTRHKGDQDWNQSRRGDPIDGANDGASGVAVLLEIARLIPTLNLTHEVTLFFTDGEDQGDNYSTYVLGAKAWADNLSQSEADSIESFVLVDMVGDSYLTLRKTTPGNMELWNRTENIIRYIDDVCELNDSSYFDFESFDAIYDDHVPAHELGIPAIDIIDTRYGENASFLGGHWHTHNDTADKVSAESLQKVGFILELGLIRGDWLDVRESENGTENINQDPCLQNSNEENPECNIDSAEEKTSLQDGDDITIGVLLVLCVILVWVNFAWLVFADNKGEG
jgi:glutaminyl-peptide cyclotransferase